MNASLQILFSIPEFLDDMKDAYNILNTIENDKKSMPLCFAFLTVASRVRVIQPLLQGEATRDGPACPSILKKEMDVLTDKFDGYKQQDAHEFLADLIDFLHDELANAKKAKGEIGFQLPTDKYFRLDVDVCLTCTSCNHSRKNEEFYRNLTVEIPQNQEEEEQLNIDKSLLSFFQPEKLECNCEKCVEGKHVVQTTTIKSNPKALLVHLKRFTTQLQNGVVTFRKNKTVVKSENCVSLEPFTEDAAKRGDSYELRGVVRHIGNFANSGHYIANALRKEYSGDGNEWVHFDDGISSKNSFENGNNYLMVYANSRTAIRRKRIPLAPISSNTDHVGRKRGAVDLAPSRNTKSAKIAILEKKKKIQTAAGKSKSEMKKIAKAAKKNREAAGNSKSMHHFFGNK